MLRMWMLVIVGCAMLAPLAAQAQEKDPLDALKEEDLVDVGYCFQKFVAAIGEGDAKLAKAFLAEVPAHLAKLDLNKPADKESFIKALSSYKGAQIIKHQKMAMAGIAMVTYADANGGEKELRMQNMGGRWKVVQ